MKIEHQITTTTQTKIFKATDDEGQVYDVTLNWADGDFEDSEVVLEGTGELADEEIAEEIVDAILEQDWQDTPILP